MHARREFWAEHVHIWRDSRLTQVDYCQQRGLKVKALGYWIRPSKQTDTPLCLVPLAVQRPSVSGELLLQHASGWRLVLPAGVDAAWLAGLLRGMVVAEAGTGLVDGRAC